MEINCKKHGITECYNLSQFDVMCKKCYQEAMQKWLDNNLVKIPASVMDGYQKEYSMGCFVR